MSSKEYLRQYAKTHRKKINETQRRWYTRNKKKAYAHSRRYILKLREDIYEKYGKVCVRCGFSDRRALQIDHVRGNGRAHRATFKNDYSYYRFVRDDETGMFQMLCANCNSIKRVENGEHSQWYLKGTNGGVVK